MCELVSAMGEALAYAGAGGAVVVVVAAAWDSAARVVEEGAGLRDAAPRSALSTCSAVVNYVDMLDSLK